MRNSTASNWNILNTSSMLARLNLLENMENNTAVETGSQQIPNAYLTPSTYLEQYETYLFCDFLIKNISSKLETTSDPNPHVKEISDYRLAKKKFEELNQSLDTMHDECEDEGFEIFDEKARENARQIINILLENFPAHEYCIYPTEDREVAIYCKPQFGRSLLILSASDGKISFYLSVENESFIFKHDSFKNIKENLKFIFNKLEDGIAVYNLVTSTKFPE